MRIAVLGAGAIGGYVGAALARGGLEVTVIARGPHFAAMKQNGVRVLSPRGDFVAYPRVADDFGSLADADVVFVAVKAYSVPDLAPQLGTLLKPGACTIWAQNGVPWWYFLSHGGPFDGQTLMSVDPGKAISESIPTESVIGTVVYCSAEISSPGVIRHVEGTRFPLGEPDGAFSDRCMEIAAALEAGGLKAPVEARLREHVWLKLVGNVAFNPVTALTGAYLGELEELPEMVDLLRAILRESAEIARKLGIELPVTLERRLAAGFAVGDHKTSMLQDLEAGKPLELDCMTGALVELAGLVGVDVPHITAVHACTKLLDRLRRADGAVSPVGRSPAIA